MHICSSFAPLCLAQSTVCMCVCVVCVLLCISPIRLENLRPRLLPFFRFSLFFFFFFLLLFTALISVSPAVRQIFRRKKNTGRKQKPKRGKNERRWKRIFGTVSFCFQPASCGILYLYLYLYLHYLFRTCIFFSR